MSETKEKLALFLDIDGVLNTIDTAKSKSVGFQGLTLDSRLLDKTLMIIQHLEGLGVDVDIIISSSWRIGKSVETLRNMFKFHTLGEYIKGKTEVLNTERGIEIKQYMDNHSEYEYCLIFDDQLDMFGMYHFFIPVNKNYGILTSNICQKNKLKRYSVWRDMNFTFSLGNLFYWCNQPHIQWRKLWLDYLMKDYWMLKDGETEQQFIENRFTEFVSKEELYRPSGLILKDMKEWSN